jgi:hypothetical protein
MKSKVYLNLKELVANHMSENGGDELFIKYNKKKIWPARERFFTLKNSVVPLNTQIELPNVGWVDLELWEYDNWLSSSQLGTFRMLVNGEERIRSYQCTLISKPGAAFSNYSLNWEVQAKK